MSRRFIKMIGGYKSLNLKLMIKILFLSGKSKDKEAWKKIQRI